MPSTRTICTLQYNPYSNREKKGYTTYTGYAPYVVGTFTGINFNPADGVNTELVLNTINDKADYLLVLDGNTIESRWFILDCNRTRGGQYQLQLYRDVVYDNLPEVMSATAFIEKGWINDVSNPLIFNQETLPTNQRKIDERLLKDNTGTPWIVGYLPRNAGLTESETIDVQIDSPNVVPINETTYNLLNRTYTYDPYNPHIFLTINGSYRVPGNAEKKEKISWVFDTNFTDYIGTGIIVDDPVYPYVTQRNTTSKFSDGINIQKGLYRVSQSISKNVTDYKSDILSIIEGRSQTKIQDLEQYNEKNVLYSGNIYHVSIQPEGESGTYYILSGDAPSGYIASLRANIYDITLEDRDRGFNYNVEGNDSEWAHEIDYKLPRWRITLTQISAGTYQTIIPEDDIRLAISKNSNFTMFCMPWNDFRIKNSDNTYTTISGDVSRQTAYAISKKYSQAGTLMDLQIVPYCPLQSILVLPMDSSSNNAIDGTKLKINQAIPIKTQNDSIISYYFWCTDNDVIFSKVFAYSSSYYNRGINNFKVNAQTVLHTIQSPNRSSAYNYNPYKVITPNDIGQLEIKYNIYCSYKPYKPDIYVEVESTSDSLYNRSFTDGRGLICAGDFSLPQFGDAWETYQIQNKNYSNIFNREIQSIELQNKYAKESDIVHAITGTISGATSAATSGGAIGGVGGSIAGGIAGGIASAVGGIADIGINETLRKDQLDLKKDLYQYNLENIQALPNTLLNVGTLTITNKLYPYIEVYDCTEIEKQALRNKIKYNGMSIGVISEGLSNYIIDDASDRSFIKGQIIRIDLHDDYHMLKNIRQEFETGFFINRGGN